MFETQRTWKLMILNRQLKALESRKEAIEDLYAGKLNELKNIK